MTMLNSYFMMMILICMLFNLPISSSSSNGNSGLSQRQTIDNGTVRFYLFGDSYVDAGNNNYINTTTLVQANFPPYGETFFHYPTGRFSDGRLVSDFIAEHAKLPLIRPYLQPGNNLYMDGVNFASSGAGALDQTLQGLVISLSMQIKYYKEVAQWLRALLGDVELKKSFSRDVYLFSIGTNDYTGPFLSNSTIYNSNSKSKYVGMVIGNLTMAIKEVYNTGGRKFGFLNLGPLGCLPVLRIIGNGGCLEEASLLAELHNEAISKLLPQLEKQLRGFRYALYDFNTNLKQRISHPINYGFKEGKTACCGIGRFRGTFSCGGKRTVKQYELCKDPNEYVFWDSIHLTERVYNQMAEQMWAGSPRFVKPYNLKQLFQCL